MVVTLYTGVLYNHELKKGEVFASPFLMEIYTLTISYLIDLRCTSCEDIPQFRIPPSIDFVMGDNETFYKNRVDEILNFFRSRDYYLDLNIYQINQEIDQDTIAHVEQDLI